MQTPTEQMLLGQEGEEIAANFLVQHGFRILDRNWKSKYHYEIDIVAFKDNLLHIVEVKTRRSEQHGTAMSAIGIAKLRKLARAAHIYKKYRRLTCDSVIDGISVVYRSADDYDVRFVPDLHLVLMQYNAEQYNRYR